VTVPDEAVVVKGGTKAIPSESFSGSFGDTLADAAQGVPHNQLQATTAGQIRKAGGSVLYDPELNTGVGRQTFST